MVDNTKRRMLQLVGTGTAALAGISSSSATTSGGIKETVNQQGMRSQGEEANASIRLPGDLYSTGLLTGSNEISSVKSPGQGIASFRSNPQETRLDYVLLALNLTSPVTGAHIHSGRRCENGPVVVDLLGDVADEKSVVGRNVVAVGSITADDLTGPLEGASLSALLADIRAQETYVNVHSKKYPKGELRDHVSAITQLDANVTFSAHATAGSGIDLAATADLQVEVSRKGSDGQKSEGH